jgi:hypothetical protein
MNKIAICCLLMWLACTSALAQNELTADADKVKINSYYRDILLSMKQHYEDGAIDSTIVLFETYCIVKGSNRKASEQKNFRRTRKETKADIYSYASRAYLALDFPDEADIYLRRLFAIRYDEPFDNYWLTVRNARKYRYFTSPRFQVGVLAGLNVVHPRPFGNFTIFESSDLAQQAAYRKSYSPIQDFTQNNELIGRQLGFAFEYALTKNLSVLTHISTQGFRFSYQNQFRWENTIPQTDITFFLDVRNKHFTRLNYFEVPLQIKYRFMAGRLQPYLSGGVAYAGLIAATRNLSSFEVPVLQMGNGPANTLFGEYRETSRNIQTFTMPLLLSGMAGAGLSYQVSDFRLVAGLQYRHGLSNIVRREKRFSEAELTFGFHDISDDLRLSSLELCFGIFLPIAHKAFKN